MVRSALIRSWLVPRQDVNAEDAYARGGVAFAVLPMVVRGRHAVQEIVAREDLQATGAGELVVGREVVPRVGFRPRGETMRGRRSSRAGWRL